MFDRRWLWAFGLVLVGILSATLPAVAGVLDASWTAPTTNTDGSPLNDLASYRVYFETSAAPCPTGTFVTVPSPSSTPPAGQTIATRLTGLTNNTVYNVSVAAVDTNGNLSACSGGASATAMPDITVAPTTSVAFGNVNLGSSAERSFTVQSNRAGVMGTASVPAPFTIVSGNPFNLGTAGSTQTVTVRFTPTDLTTRSVNVTFTADGDSASRLVTGTGMPIGPTLTVTKSGAGIGTITSSAAGINCGSSCAASFATGTQVTLTAAPATGSTFTGWSGGGCTGTGTCVVTMTADATVTAGFVVQSPLTVNTSGTGTGTVTSAPTANFTVPTFVLTVNRVGGGGGTVTSTPAGINCGSTCSFAFNNNTMVTLTAAPAAGSAFTSWTGACTGSDACTVTMSAARTVTAMFGVSTVTLTDAPLVPQTTIKTVHVAELRAAIAMARARNGVAAFTWGDRLTAKTTAIKAGHIAEMRTAINQIYKKLGRRLPTYTDPILVPGRTVVKSAHIQELRNAVSALP